MKRREEHAGHMMVNSRTFVHQTPELAVLGDAPATQLLDSAIAGFQAGVAAQQSAGLAIKVDRQRLDELADTIVGEYMNPVTQFARKNLRGAPDFAALTKAGRRRATTGLASHARAMATAATPLIPQFTAAKFPADFIPTLGRLADDLDAAVEAAARTKAGRVAATKQITQAVAKGKQAVATLDPIVNTMLKGSHLLASWRSVKRVSKAGTSGSASVTSEPVQPVGVAAATPAVTPITPNNTEVKTAA